MGEHHSKSRRLATGGRPEHSIALATLATLAVGAFVACASTEVAPETDAGPSVAGATPNGDSSRTDASALPAPDAGPRDLPCAIEAIFSRHCLECHDGSLDLPRLVTHEDLVRRLPTVPDRSLGEVALGKMTAERGFMPPPPRARVRAEDVAILKAWLEAGSPRGTCPEPSLDASTSDASPRDASLD